MAFLCDQLHVLQVVAASYAILKHAAASPLHESIAIHHGMLQGILHTPAGQILT